MRYRSKRRFRVGKAKREHIWVANYSIGQLHDLDGQGFGQVIVDGGDWARDIVNVDNIEKGATLLRIVGDLQFRTDNGAGTVSPGGASFIWGITKMDADDTSVPTLGSDWFGEDWMQLHSGQIAPNNATTSAYAPVPQQQFPSLDIKVKRKLTSDDVIRFWAAGLPVTGVASATEGLVYDLFLRCLIQLP